MSGSAFALDVAGLTRVFDGRTVVDNVDLTLGNGEILTLVGPSGCGKSTLMRLISGLDPADAGRVRVGGRDVTKVAAEHRHIGFVFQESSLFGHLRVAQNVAFGLRHLPRSERSTRVEEMLELVQLGGLGGRYPHQLSGGEQQRVALARALAPRPRIVLLDEPFASLDEVLREDLGHQVVSILRAARTASILVTHDRHEAMTLGDRIAVMHDGRIEQCDTPETVYRTPATRFVASFVEVASFISDGFMSDGKGSVFVARPHHLSVTAGGNDRVVRVEFLGSGYRYTVRRADGTEAVVDAAVRADLQVGDACTVGVKAPDLHRLA